MAPEHDHGAAVAATQEKDVITIRTVLEMMRYDTTTIKVKAGKPVKIVLINDDFMPHNMVIGLSGSAEEIGTKAEAMGAAGFEKGFIPVCDKILHFTKMIDHQGTATLEFTAPTQPGNYDMVCTFPGHWRLMRGTMQVQ